MLEVRYFIDALNLKEDIYVINDTVWEDAKADLKNKFQRSSKLEICNNIIRDFELTNPKKKYKSDLDTFIRESRLEDFYNDGGETILVSTIHKAKGKEFDNVFLLINGLNPETDEVRRQLYVAMTRAKQNLTIHLNTKFLDFVRPVENMHRLNDNNSYELPTKIVTQLTYKDVWLDFFINKQSLVSQFVSGDKLTIVDDSCVNLHGQSVLKFSKSMLLKIEDIISNDYELDEASVNFIVYWKKEDSDNEVMIILPEIHFKRKTQI